MTEGRFHPPRRLEASWLNQAARELLSFAQISALRHPMPAIEQCVFTPSPASKLVPTPASVRSQSNTSLAGDSQQATAPSNPHSPNAARAI